MVSLVHESQLALHRLRRNHGNVLEAQRLENILVEEIVQRYFSNSLEGNTSPIYVDLA